jgi:secreted PhoX family phosphatase
MISKSLIVALLGAGAAQAAEFSFNTLIRSGQPATAEYPFGTVVSSNASKVLTNELEGETYGQWNPMYPNNKTAVTVSNNPDFFSIFDAPDGGMVGFVHFESPNPSGVYALGLKQAKDGTLSVTSTEPVDFSEYGGAWILCAGTNSPWGSHLGGEEYEPDAYKFEKAGCLFESQCGEESLQILDEDGFGSTISMLRYFGLYAADNVTTLDEVKKVFNPYDYGYTIEIVPESSTNGKGSKWYTSGRLSQELAYVMPNNQTMYITDDGTNVGFFRVEMDKPNDLSSTTIYAAKLDQKSAENGGQFDMSWVELGSNTQEALQAAIKGGIQFSDMFTGVAPVNGTCPDGYTSINQGGDGQECLTIVSGQENLAAYLEPRRYAAYLGATTEGSKWEGFVYDPYTKKAYTSISDVRYGMENKQKKGEDEPKYDQGGPNAIQLPYNPCGCVFALEFDDNFVATNFNAALCGTPMEEDQFGQTCEVTGVSNPDNLNRIGKTILIGEDTDNHQVR